MDNYDKFCVGVRAVADIKDIVARQSDQFAEAKARHQALKNFYVLQVQQVICKRAGFARKKKTLDLLLGLQQRLGRFVSACRRSQECLEGLGGELPAEEALARVRDLLADLKDFEAAEKKIKQEVEALDPKLLPFHNRLTLLVGRGSLK